MIQGLPTQYRLLSRTAHRERTSPAHPATRFAQNHLTASGSTLWPALVKWAK